ncbi:hypothetical protein OOK36_38960 [Streptomyces sp. NBC_00365]|uniref:hypothetical protein n=1 Tax=Streptomyces sp. NBC_00365 TaxID=2975726 RepID=UPI002258A0EB|nr:hypothetical protein [Streptomyces sp. NBC_00365]MCX5094736.1 hypothetical protein [Streptomyces sp. NBC_00365]
MDRGGGIAPEVLGRLGYWTAGHFKQVVGGLLCRHNTDEDEGADRGGQPRHPEQQWQPSPKWRSA